MILFIHSFQVLNTLSCMVLTAVNADVGGHFNLVIGLLVFRRRRLTAHALGAAKQGEKFNSSSIYPNKANKLDNKVPVLHLHVVDNSHVIQVQFRGGGGGMLHGKLLKE